MLCNLFIQLSALIALATITITLNALETEEYPKCGDCWCVPQNEGMGPCPIWEPRTDFSDITISTYAAQIPSWFYRLDCNPYEDNTCTTTPPQELVDNDATVCAFKYEFDSDGSAISCSEYQMVSYPTREEAAKDGAVLTHTGSCGLCSTTKDLSIYLSQDFAQAGKICATKGLLNETNGLHCYMDLGLTEECAKIWNYDGIFDGKACGATCAGDITAPNNGPAPTCALSDCLQCDEDLAGPLFSAFAGRTRRRSGLKSEIVRPCDSVSRIFRHDPCMNPACEC